MRTALLSLLAASPGLAEGARQTLDCRATQACDDATEAFGACVARLCEAADELCGCFGCSSDCRGGEQRCYAACIVEAGSCDGEGEAYWTCVEGCYQGEVGTSSGTGGFDG